jgi:CRISPR system Cascade subunit CasC
MTSNLVVDIHVLQTLPPSNVNRDDTGSPKTAIYGGVRRARVSSQSWKRAMRSELNSYLDSSELSVRTKRVTELLAKEIVLLASRYPEEANNIEDKAQELAAKAFESAGIKVKDGKSDSKEASYLMFIGKQQLMNLAEEVVTAYLQKEAIDKKVAKNALKGHNSIDLALFGRMVADITDLNVDACAQVAHAISVHGVETEYDFFTAVDELKEATVEEDAGAAMLGTVEFNSSTLYRYATVNVAELYRSLGDLNAAKKGTEAFVKSFVFSIPTGKQNSFAHRTLPDLVYVVLRKDQSVSLVGAFETPLQGSGSGGRVVKAAATLASYANDITNTYGNNAYSSWVLGIGDNVVAPFETIASKVTIDSLTTLVGDAVFAHLQGRKEDGDAWQHS